MEQSRLNILEKVIDSLKIEQSRVGMSIEQDMIAFDNGSTLPGSIEQLQRLNCPLYVSKQNRGYWSALYWILENVVDYEKYDYIYVIESDHVHFALDKIQLCETALNTFGDIGSVRTQEYSVKNQHLYNKTKQHQNGVKHAWVAHVNSVTKEPVKLFETKIIDIWRSNFLTCLHSVNRLKTLRSVFEQLVIMNRFSEKDFQAYYHSRFPTIGQLDGGVFNASLGFTPANPGSLSGSWSSNVQQFGYKETRNDSIVLYNKDDVKLYNAS